MPPVDTATQHRFDEGHRVGNIAKQLFPKGIDIPTNNFMGNIRQTENFLNLGKPLFEAGVLSNRLYSRADILNPTEDNMWDIYEVKSSTDSKEVNFHDVAFQRGVYQQAGINVNRCFLIYLNKDYVKYGEVNPEGLLALEDISTAVDDASIGMEERIKNMLAVIDSRIRPSGVVGNQCFSPWDCDMKSVCHQSLEENVMTEKPDATKDEIRRFLEKLEYPLAFLEIKTIRPAIPFFDGTRPYQHVPFLFSLHMIESPDSPSVHHSFLAEDAGDPRPAFLVNLKNLLGFRNNNIIVSNAPFIKGILRELALSYPEHQGWTDSAAARIVDIPSPFNEPHYFDLVEKDTFDNSLSGTSCAPHQDKRVENNIDAGIAFLQIASGNISSEEAEEIKKDLTNSCKIETAGMVKSLEKLSKFSS
ncbi:MAG: DUF2779 domain-containing protein [Syntrophomonadaceae bacterium]|nr:DUF2779 domain-containing protein [Syntrophomonadaceae bacterium]